MSTSDKGGPAASFRVAVLLGDKSNPFWAEMVREYESLAPGLGMSVDFFWGEPEKDRDAQLRKLQAILEGPHDVVKQSFDAVKRGFDVVKQGFDAVVVNPIGNRNLVPGIVRAGARGIPVLDVGAKTDQESVRGVPTYYPVRTVDFFAQGLMAGAYIGERLSESGGGKVAIVEGRPDSAQSIGRSAGAARAFESAPGVRLACREQADFDRSKARAAAERVLEREPDVAAFFCANDVMALGVSEAIGRAGRAGAIVVGVDLTPESREAIRRGSMTASVAFSPASVARVVLDAVVRVMTGRELEKGYTVESTLVTVENVDSYEG